ncbi:MAG TPA: DUF447 family protein [Methanocorpusculum sp.]|nr:DUF447 family protein [Methanocorpusculum sp.]HJK01723.1 DUF447 family protein [Methanocorpusculum sp.]
MGLLREGITEVIAVTHDNAAPMGIIVKPGMCPKMVLFKGSKTASNIHEYGWVTANFVSDCYLYPQYAFSNVSLNDLMDVFIDGIMMQRLLTADAWIAFRTTILHETEHTYYTDLLPVASEYIRKSLYPINRGFNSVIDATVHATRYVHTKDDLRHNLIEYHLGIIAKCGGPREREAGQLLRKICDL